MFGSFRFSLLRTCALSLLIFAATITGTLSASKASNAAAFFQGADEFVTVYAKDCRTPQIVFNLGDTVCITAGNFLLPPSDNFQYRRLSWVAPDLTVANQALIQSDPQTEYFEIPASGDLAQAGTWYATTINVHSGRRANGKFYVRNPRVRLVDLSISKSAPESVLPGTRVMYKLAFHNPGPDFAEYVEFTDEVPSNMTFYALKQVSGPEFECAMPERGKTGSIVCATKGLQLDETAEFAVYYIVDSDLKEGTVCNSLSYISSRIEELRKEDNYSKTETMVPFPDAGGEGEIEP